MKISNFPSQDFLLRWMEKRISLLGYESAMSESSNSQAIIDFITGPGPKTLCIATDKSTFNFSCYETGKSELQQVDLCAYFLRQSIENTGILMKENVDREVQYGTVGGNGLSLAVFNRIMRGGLTLACVVHL